MSTSSPERQTEWVCVPREPTEEMLKAGGYALRDYLKTLSKEERDAKHPNHPIAENVWGRQFQRQDKARIRYSAMLAASPQTHVAVNRENLEKAVEVLHSIGYRMTAQLLESDLAAQTMERK